MEQYTYTNSKGTVYYLNCKSVTLKYGGKSNAYYFSRNPNPETAVGEPPEGRTVIESNRSFAPFLKKINL